MIAGRVGGEFESNSGAMRMFGDGYSRMYAIDIAQSVASRLKIAEESQTAIEKKRWRARARERERERERERDLKRGASPAGPLPQGAPKVTISLSFRLEKRRT